MRRRSAAWAPDAVAASIGWWAGMSAYYDDFGRYEIVIAALVFGAVSTIPRYAVGDSADLAGGESAPRRLVESFGFAVLAVAMFVAGGILADWANVEPETSERLAALAAVAATFVVVLVLGTWLRRRARAGERASS